MAGFCCKLSAYIEEVRANRATFGANTELIDANVFMTVITEFPEN